MKTLCLIIWMTITLILTFSVIGMLLFIGESVYHKNGDTYERYKSTWMEMGIKLLNDIIENNQK